MFSLEQILLASEPHRSFSDEFCARVISEPPPLQTGLFQVSGQEFFIRPLEESGDAAAAAAPQAHAVYRRHASPPAWISPGRAVNGTCGVKSKQTDKPSSRRVPCISHYERPGPRRGGQRNHNNRLWQLL